MDLLERRTQLEALVAYATEARAGDGRLVLVAGEAGVGKSVLVEAAERAVHEAHPDARYLWGRCDGQFTPRPLGPVVEVAEELGGSAWEAVRRDAPRQELFAAFRDGLRGSDLTVVVLEDLHWADDATLDLLRYLGRRLRGLPVLVVATYRDDALGVAAPVRVVLGDLAAQGSTRRVDVPPLSRDAVVTLVEGTDIEPGELHRRTGGNPFFVTEVLRSGSTVVPPSARDAVLARTTALSASARAALDVAALIGSRVEPDLVGAVVPVTTTDLDELVESGLLVGDGPGLRFRHDIARQAVDEAVAPHRRTATHRAVLDELVRRGSTDDARLAHHAENGGAEDRALHHARRAGDSAAAKGAHREAAAQYERAARCSGALGPRGQAELLDALALELSVVDAWEQSAEARQRALTIWRDLGDRLREGDDLRRLCGVMWRLCRGPESVAAARDAVRVLEPLGPTVELGWAYLYRALDATDDAAKSADLERAEAVVDALAGHAEPSMWTHLSGQVLMVRSELAYSRREAWEPDLRAALALGLDSGNDLLTSSAYASLHQFLVTDSRFDDASALYDDGIAFTDERDITTYSTCLRGRRALALVALGRWDEAERTARTVLRTPGSPVNLLTSQVAGGLVRTRRGESDRGLLDDALTAATTLDEAEWLTPTCAAAAEAAWLQGDDITARARLAAARARIGALNVVEDAQIRVWEHRLGVDPGDPRRLVNGLPEPLRRHVVGDFSGAALAWDVVGCAYDAGLALLDEGSEQSLRAALVRFEGLGAAPAASMTRRRLRALGARSVPVGIRATTRAHPAGLTTREAQVLDLLGEGLTNDEIAARLFISTKTVDHHVSAVLGKLAAPTRRDAVAAAGRLGLAASER
jgi:DNA-binding CsgD family transcriptional regulator/tetratricopeptide (TPR) repeat protein